uniref:Uncharacterized protein n=1 Tax=Siphoviridae sp. ctd9R8 TaxID=2825576 RepID=A0A8S5PU34_9CAUD|nr:MAG TPA: hypothetical protein [Siphoviridae sp. ctd9R8]
MHCVYSVLYFVLHSIECAPTPKEKSRSIIGAALYIFQAFRLAVSALLNGVFCPEAL